MNLQQLRTLPAARSTLDSRALALARVDESAEDAAGAVTLTFVLGGGSYALPAASVDEVLPLGAITALPCVPPFVVGLVNVRGRLVAALDLRPLLDLPAAPPAPNARLLIVGADDAVVGLLVDEVTAVRQSTLELAPTPSSAAGRGVPWLRGVDAALSLHIDPFALLANPRLLVNEEAEVQ